MKWCLSKCKEEQRHSSDKSPDDKKNIFIPIPAMAVKKPPHRNLQNPHYHVDRRGKPCYFHPPAGNPVKKKNGQDRPKKSDPRQYKKVGDYEHPHNWVHALCSQT